MSRISDWERLGIEALVAAAVPDAYEAYRRPIASALVYFLEGLPEPQVHAIVTDQTTLPAETSPEERLVALAHHSPTLHKLGQVLARDRRLDLALRSELQGLESMEPRTPVADVRAILDGDLGDLAAEGVFIEPRALAEASVAVVVPFWWRRDGQTSPRRGVFKVLKPGIAERMDRELERLEDVGAWLDEQCAEFGLPPLDYRATFEQVRERLGHEVRLEIEQHNLATARAMLAGLDRVVVPELFPFRSSRVTAMERIDGRKVTEGLGGEIDRRDLARRIVEALLAEPIWSPAPESMFHADPHAGNLFVLSDGRLAILDWSLVGTLGRAERQAIVQVLLGALTLDDDRILRALGSLSAGEPDRAALAALVADALRQIRRGRWPGFDWLTDLLDGAVQRARLRAGADLIVFRKALLTLTGVVADVAGAQGLDGFLSVSFLRRLVAEWPVRALSAPDSRTPGTHLSNADLAGVLLSAPTTAARWWFGAFQDGRDGQ